MQYRHKRRPAAADKGLLYLAVIARQEGVDVKHEEAIAEQWQGPLQRSTRPQQGRSIRGVTNVQPEGAPIRHHRLNLLTEVSDAQHHARNALAAQIVELAAY